MTGNRTPCYVSDERYFRSVILASHDSIAEIARKADMTPQCMKRYLTDQHRRLNKNAAHKLIKVYAPQMGPVKILDNTAMRELLTPIVWFIRAHINPETFQRIFNVRWIQALHWCAGTAVPERRRLAHMLAVVTDIWGGQLTQLPHYEALYYACGTDEKDRKWFDVLGKPKTYPYLHAAISQYVNMSRLTIESIANQSHLGTHTIYRWTNLEVVMPKREKLRALADICEEAMPYLKYMPAYDVIHEYIDAVGRVHKHNVNNRVIEPAALARERERHAKAREFTSKGAA